MAECYIGKPNPIIFVGNNEDWEWAYNEKDV